MKKTLQKAICILSCILFSLLPLSVTAFATESYDIDSFANVTCVDNVEKIEISETSLNKMSRRMINLSDEEKVDAILEQFNVKNLKGTKHYNELVNDFDEIGTINGSIAYMKVDEAGNQTIMSKKDCLAAVEAENSQQKLSTGSVIDSNSQKSKNGYLMQVIIVVYLKNEPKGTYFVLCSSEWLKLPVFRSKDAISVSSREMKWDTSTLENFEGYCGYDKTTTIYDNNIITYRNTESIAEVPMQMPENPNANEGFYYTWNLPNDYTTVVAGNGVTCSYSNLVATVIGKARVQNYGNTSQMLSVDYRYLHIQGGINLKDLVFDMVFEKSKWYVAVIKNLTVVKKEYDFAHSWDYAKHANL